MLAFLLGLCFQHLILVTSKNIHLGYVFSSNLFILQWFHSGHKGKVFLERSNETYFF